MRKVPHSFEVHSNESACRKSGRLGLEQVIEQPHPAVVLYRDELMDHIPLLSVDTGMDPHEVYGLMSCVAETATPPTYMPHD